MNKKISEIVIGDRFRRNLGSLQDLCRSISEVGLLHPIVISSKDELIAGLRRLMACKSMGWKEIAVTVIDPDNPKRAEADENLVRRSFTISEAVAVKEFFLSIEKPKAEERKAEGQKKGGQTAGRGRRKVGANSAPSNDSSPSERKARTKAAAATGYGHEKLRQAEVVQREAKKDPERFGTIADEMERTGKVSPAYKRVMAMLREGKEPPPRKVKNGFSHAVSRAIEAYQFLTDDDKLVFKKWLREQGNGKEA